MNWLSVLRTLLISMVTLLAISMPVFADGTEALGAPSIAIASGTGMVAAGVGLDGGQPGVIDIDVPAGATVQQVLLYWSGEFIVATDDTITVNGVEVLGDLIGGPTVFFQFNGDVSLATYRADITGLGLVSAGNNLIPVGGLNFGLSNSGAGILVIFDDGSPAANIDIRDGQDLAFVNFASPLDTTVAQTFNFAAAGVDRTAELNIFASSVGGANRPNAIDVTVNGVTTKVVNPLGSFDGDFWDTFTLPVNIPAGATSVTVQVLSESDGSANLPASLNWIAAGLPVPPPPPPPPGGEGCTPGYWKNHLEDWPTTGLSPGDDFDTTFGVDLFSPDITLEEAVNAKGGGNNKLARHGTAALLSALHPDVDYPLSPGEVTTAVQAGDVDPLVAANELGCDIP